MLYPWISTLILTLVLLTWINSSCVIDCTTRQAQIMSYFAAEGMACHQNETYRCHLGKCKSPDDGIDYPSDLYNLKIQIKSAHVPDEDDLPTAGSSDTFITVLVENDGGPNFNDGDLVCHTYVVQDNSNPKWKNFVCEPPPMKSTTSLKFIATDSDKPSEHIDILGTAVGVLDSLLNVGPVKLRLQRPENSEAYYYVEVDVSGEKFKGP